MGFVSTTTSLHDRLPTLGRLNATVPDDLDVQKVAQDWLTRFSQAVKAKDVSAVLNAIHPDGWWRDLVALTWDLRAFQGAEKMRKFLDDRLVETQFSASPQVISATLLEPYPDLQWIAVAFGFERPR